MRCMRCMRLCGNACKGAQHFQLKVGGDASVCLHPQLLWHSHLNLVQFLGTVLQQEMTLQ